MTTIIAVKTNFPLGEEAIVLGSDTQLSIISDPEEKPMTKRRTLKIIYGSTWALANEGRPDIPDIQQFLGILSGKKKLGSSEERARQIIAKAIENYDKGPKYENPHFEEVLHYHMLAARKGEDKDDIPTYVLAANKPRIGLWWVDGYGNLHESKSEKERRVEYICKGSGEDKVNEYIENLVYDEKVDLSATDIPIAIDIVVATLHKAEEDAYTGGPIDMLVVTKQSVTPFGARIKKALDEAEMHIIRNIKAEYAPPQPPEKPTS